MSAMQMGLNMGIQVKDIENMTKNAAALSGHTHMGLTMSMRMLTQAQEGHFQAFMRYIPKLRECTDDTQRYAMVNDLLTKGWKEATAETPLGEITKLKQEWADLEKIIGEALVPSLIKLVEYARAILVPIQNWVSAHKELVTSIIEISAGILTAIVWGPKIFSIMQSIGGVISWLVTSPIGLLITGLGAVISWLAYTMGTGDEFIGRMKSGFLLMIDWIDKMCGSWKKLKDTLKYVWDSVRVQAEGIFEYLQISMERVWNRAAGAMKTAWQAIGPWIMDNVMMPLAAVLGQLEYKIQNVLTAGQPGHTEGEYVKVAQNEMAERFGLRNSNGKAMTEDEAKAQEKLDWAEKKLRMTQTVHDEEWKKKRRSELGMDAVNRGVLSERDVLDIVEKGKNTGVRFSGKDKRLAAEHINNQVDLEASAEGDDVAVRRRAVEEAKKNLEEVKKASKAKAVGEDEESRRMSAEQERALDARQVAVQKRVEEQQKQLKEDWKSEMNKKHRLSDTPMFKAIKAEVEQAYGTYKKEGGIGTIDVYLRKFFPEYAKIMDEAKASLKEKKDEALKPPTGIEKGEGVSEKTHIRFEDAAGMYKRIASAAAGRTDPMLTEAQRQTKIQTELLAEQKKTNAAIQAGGHGLGTFKK